MDSEGAVCEMIPQWRLEAARQREDGFGLIEIVVSMFLLALLAVAFLPLLITSMKTTVKNSTIATATQLVSQQMEQARAAGDTCTALTAYGNPSPALAAVTDARGNSYQAARAVEVCPTLATAYPRTARVTVTVSVAGSAVPAQTATTLVYLKAP
ncbi:prepilin-type N-terminal cleavage/methylation domain-containing protein [Cryobacterium tagatosivorans]|uniref:Type II secretion system protein n=1 Tax=Cryobacterium tagatosivorans TaxID=1259199 RepID=A0A4R8UEL0_9MICO|nr:prepilin-type N-terminal cleavage/methylation domain-containing protein [Cryobacterium tagatosivorans]TFB48430.1 hypothetical protein E3O23_13255 [Cryobacterium tagatosivorans]